MKKLWQKNWELDSFIESFETKGDLVLDQKLVAADVYCSLAHAKMLYKIRILSKEELQKLVTGFHEILSLYKNGEFILQAGDEDVHTKIENYITEKYGEVGKKIHTGRSRNDQVATALRFYTKEQLFFIWKELLELCNEFYLFAKKYEFVSMPGYTHMQKAMPSSVGMWAGAFTEGLLSDLILFKAAFTLNDVSPLGSAAGYGSSLSVDRNYSASLLGFENIVTNSLYCQNARGKDEGAILAALIAILSDINKFATDVLLFTNSEFDYFTVSKKLCSGSSIMPQKKNVDVAELLRSKVHILLGYYQQVVSLSSNLPSGYNRDIQDTKKPLFESLQLTQDCLKAARLLLNGITPKKENMKMAVTPEVFATHKAFELVKQGTPFRQAYQKVGENLSLLEQENVDEVLQTSHHIGGTGNLGLGKYLEKYQQEKKEYQMLYAKHKLAIKNLLKGGETV